MPIRNPFRKAGTTSGLEAGHDENTRPTSRSGADTGFEKAQLAGSKPSPAQSIRIKNAAPNEYKLSVVNDSGVYLPPSPPEKTSFWHGSNASITSSNHRSMLSENEPFSISRESFDSYRRSFDISARSPVTQPDAPPRQSLDSRFARLPKSAVTARRLDREPPTAEEGFEDVGLHDEAKPKKKSIFSRFADSSDASVPPHSSTSSAHFGFHLPGRKLGHSGQGAELGKIDRPGSSGPAEIKVDS
ncbi:MAG: hypothetical protein M1832_005077 [Thelocarpon impressellum]|nr:MAG: hypothetical protein M1832_005077 [Thelocarpon impressellum]